MTHLFRATETGWQATAAARRTDPATSHEAARLVEASGRAAAQRTACLDEVRRRPGQTAAEVAQALGLERHAPSRRLPELERAGLVRRGQVKKQCTVMGTAAMTWWPLRATTTQPHDAATNGPRATLDAERAAISE